MGSSQMEKALRFRALHDGPAFVLPNPWDVASARLLAGLGFAALATSSAASAVSIGKRDGGLTREEAIAAERIAAAVEAARALPCPFVLTARAHGLLYGGTLDQVIARLQAFERSGGDVLFAPALPDLAAVRTVCTAVSKPVNFMVGMKGMSFPVAALIECVVRRISLATSLHRAAMSGFLNAVRQVQEAGRFDFVDELVSTGDLLKIMEKGGR